MAVADDGVGTVATAAARISRLSLTGISRRSKRVGNRRTINSDSRSALQEPRHEPAKLHEDCRRGGGRDRHHGWHGTVRRPRGCRGSARSRCCGRRSGRTRCSITTPFETDPVSFDWNLNLYCQGGTQRLPPVSSPSTRISTRFRTGPRRLRRTKTPRSGRSTSAPTTRVGPTEPTRVR